MKTKIALWAETCDAEEEEIKYPKNKFWFSSPFTDILEIKCLEQQQFSVLDPLKHTPFEYYISFLIDYFLNQKTV